MPEFIAANRQHSRYFRSLQKEEEKERYKAERKEEHSRGQRCAADEAEAEAQCKRPATD